MSYAQLRRKLFLAELRGFFCGVFVVRRGESTNAQMKPHAAPRPPADAFIGRGLQACLQSGRR